MKEKERSEFTNAPLGFWLWKGTAATSKDNDSPIPVLSSKRPASRGNHLLFLLPSLLIQLSALYMLINKY